MHKKPEFDRREFLNLAALGASTGGASVLPQFQRSASQTNPNGTFEVFNVKDYGAAGDDISDDTAAVQSAIAAALNAGGGTIYFPSGNYLITETLSFDSLKEVEVVGNGWSSNILWSFDGNLFQWDPSCREVTVRDLKITSAVVNKSAASAVISCKGGVERALFDHLLVMKSLSFNPGTGIEFVGVCDSTTIRDCQFWDIKGTGVRLGHGSEIRIMGGRIIGNGRYSGSTGIHLTGNNGGVHIVETDVINHQWGVYIDNSSGDGSNREVFITHATLDSCWRGLSLNDNSYVSIAGCWAASCDQENIHIEAGLANPIVVVSGGTIFAAGDLGGDSINGRNGITVNSGSFILSGVTVRNNLGTGIWVPNSSVQDYTITGCRVADNGQGARLDGSSYIAANNVFARNGIENQFLGSNFLVENNVNS